MNQTITLNPGDTLTVIAPPTPPVPPLEVIKDAVIENTDGTSETLVPPVGPSAV